MKSKYKSHPFLKVENSKEKNEEVEKNGNGESFLKDRKNNQHSLHSKPVRNNNEEEKNRLSQTDRRENFSRKKDTGSKKDSKTQENDKLSNI